MMAAMTEKMLEKWSENVAAGFISAGTPLNDGVTKLAQENDLNPEQVRRLVEASNTATFLQKFNSMAEPDTQSDRMVEFETADANAVINRMLDMAKQVMDAPACAAAGDDTDLSAALPITRSEAAPDTPEKEGSTEEPAEPKIRGHIVIMRLRKTAEQIRDLEYQHRVSYTETVQGLVDRFRVVGTDFDTFEKNALYHYGESAAPHLQLIRQALRKEAATYNIDTLRKVARVVDSRQPAMRDVESLLQHTAERRHAKKALERVQGHLAKLT